MKTDNEANRELTISILSNHKTLLESLTSWLYHKYPGYNYKTFPKKESQLSFLDSSHKQIVIIDIGLSFLTDLGLIDYIQGCYPDIKIIAVTPFQPGILEKKLKGSKLLSIIPKWKISNKLPAIIDLTGEKE